MITPELRSYLDSLRDLPEAPRPEELRGALGIVGWDENVIDEAVDYFFAPEIPSFATRLSEFVLPAEVAPEVPAEMLSQTAPEILISVAPTDEVRPEAIIVGVDSTQEELAAAVSDAAASTLAVEPEIQTSQSLLYPDNSSRLGFKDGTTEQQPLVEKFTPPEVLPTANAVENLGSISSQPKMSGNFVPMADITFSKNETTPAPRSINILSSDAVPPPVTPPPLVRPAPVWRPSTPPVTRVPMADVRPARNAPAQNVVLQPAPVALRIPVQNPAAISAPVTAAISTTAKNPIPVVPHRSRIGLLIFLLAILLGVGASVGYAYYVKIGPFASAGPYRAESFAADIVSGLSKIKTGIVTVAVTGDVVARGDTMKSFVSTESIAATTSPFTAFLSPFDVSSKQYLSFIPPDAGFSLAVSGTFDRTKHLATSTDGRVTVSGRLRLSGTEFTAALEGIRAQGIAYVRVGTVPVVPESQSGMFGNFLSSLSALSGKWIRLDGEAAQSALSFTPQAISGVLEEKNAGDTAQRAEQFIKTVIEALDAERLILQVNPAKKASEDGRVVYRYSLSVDTSRLGSFYRRLSNAFRTTASADVSLLEAADEFAKMAAAFEKPETAALLSYNASHSTLVLSADAEGILRSVEWTFVAVPGEGVTALSGKQISIVTKISLSGVNEAVVVSAPAEVISVQEASRIAKGYTEDEFKFATQLENITSIRSALDTYHDIAGHYPATLSELQKTATEVMSGSERDVKKSFLFERYENKKILSIIPVDVYGGSLYAYTVGVDGKDYQLTYGAVLPEYREDSRLTKEVVHLFTDKAAGVYALLVNNGINSATAFDFSKEATVLAKTDTDAGGVSDSLEKYLGLNPGKKDSNSDGVTDRAELDAKYSPFGSGMSKPVMDR